MKSSVPLYTIERQILYKDNDLCTLDKYFGTLMVLDLQRLQKHPSQ